MLGIILADMIRNTEIRHLIIRKLWGLSDCQRPYSGDGHDTWLDRRKALTEWWPTAGRRNPGHPIARWVDDIEKVWNRDAQDHKFKQERRQTYDQR